MRARAIEKHPNGRLYVRHTVGGKTRRIFLGTCERDARKKLREMAAASGVTEMFGESRPTSRLVLPSGGKDIHVKELAVRYLEWVKANRSPSTFAQRQRSILLALEFLGSKMVMEIQRSDLESFRGWIKQGHARRPDGGWHPMRDAKSMISWGNQQEFYNFPLNRFPPISQSQGTTKRLTDEDVDKLLSAAKGDFADLLRFALMTGLRPQEIRGLMREHIVWDNPRCPMIRIEHHKTSASAKVPRPRSVPLTDEAAAIVRRQLASHPKSDHVFLNDDGTPYERSVFRNRLVRLCRKAGIPERSPYSLRHRFGTVCAQNTNLAILAQLMGHTNLQTTCRYVANSEEAHLKAVGAMAESLHGKGAVGDGVLVPFVKAG